MKRKILCLFLCAVLFCIPLTAHAALPETETPIQPQWDVAANCDSYLSVTNGNALCDVQVVGEKAYCNKIKITMTLQKKVMGIWIGQEIWSTTVNHYQTYFSQTATVSSGTYRVKGECEVYSGTLCDEITVYSNQVTV